MKRVVEPSVTDSQIAHRLVIQHFSDAFEESLAHIAIRIENALAGAFDGGRIQRRPINNIGGKGAGEFERLVMRLGRKGGDDVEARVFEIFECVRAMFGYVDADFVHNGDGESIAFAAPYPGRREIDLPAEEMPAEGFRHRRAHRISRTGEKHGLRAVFYGGVRQGGAPASCPARIGAQPFQCNATTRVKIRRAVSWSQSSLPLSRSMRRSAASL
jgi:hypothetical protein